MWNYKNEEEKTQLYCKLGEAVFGTADLINAMSFLRAKMGLSVEDVAKQCYLNPEVIREMEDHRYCPEINVLLMILRVYGKGLAFTNYTVPTSFL